MLDINTVKITDRIHTVKSTNNSNSMSGTDNTNSISNVIYISTYEYFHIDHVLHIVTFIENY